MPATPAAAAAPALRDIHLPPAPSWWPPAPGWWILAALLLGLAAFAVMLFVRRRRRLQRRRALLAEFERAVALARGDAPALTATLSAFLRRTQWRHAPQAVALSGDAWLAHLDAQFDTDAFTAGPGRALADAPYRPNALIDEAALVDLTRRSLLAALAAQEAPRTARRRAAHG